MGNGQPVIQSGLIRDAVAYPKSKDQGMDLFLPAPISPSRRFTSRFDYFENIMGMHSLHDPPHRLLLTRVTSPRSHPYVSKGHLISKGSGTQEPRIVLSVPCISPLPCSCLRSCLHKVGCGHRRRCPRGFHNYRT